MLTTVMNTTCQSWGRPTDRPAFSLRRLRLKNYRSIGSCDLGLGLLAIFVGQNGAGKSNILDSLRFIRQALEENLSRAVSERGGIASI